MSKHFFFFVFFVRVQGARTGPIFNGEFPAQNSEAATAGHRPLHGPATGQSRCRPTAGEIVYITTLPTKTRVNPK